MQVREIMSKQVELVNPASTIQDAAKIMQTEHVGALPVGEDDRLVGMLTDRDIAVRSSADGKDPKQTQVRDIMTKNVEYCYDDDDLAKTRKLMEEKKIRRLVVLDHDKHLSGILSIGDIATETDNTEMSGEILYNVSSGEPSNA